MHSIKMYIVNCLIACAHHSDIQSGCIILLGMIVALQSIFNKIIINFIKILPVYRLIDSHE